MNFNRISAIAAVAFVAMPFALVACSDSSSTIVNEPVADADLEPTPGMSSGTECQGISIPEGFLCLQEACNAENEGQVIAAEHGNPKYGYQVLYAQCKQGSWTNVEPWAACDTAGVAVGDTCSEATFKGGFQFGGSTHAYYIYAGDGVWKEIEPVPADSSESTTLELGKCSSENEGKVEVITEYKVGHATASDRYGSPAYYRCESGSWVKGDITLTCDTANVQVGDACIKTVSRPPNPMGITAIYTYAGDGNWTPDECNSADGEYAKKLTVGADRKTEYFQCTSWYGWREIDDVQYACFAEFADKDTCVIEAGDEKSYYKKELEPTTYASFWKKIDGENSSSATELPSIECNLQNEGLYETVIDTVTVYPDGKVWDRDVYYHCESGEWVKTKCRDPQDACTSDNEGEYRDVVCYSSQGNPKSEKTEWTFKCMDNKWKKLSDEEVGQLKAEKDSAEVEGICNEQNKPEPKLGDVCSISRQGGNTTFGIVYTTLVCNVYTEDGWVAKWWGTPSEKSCEEILATPADTTPAE